MSLFKAYAQLTKSGIILFSVVSAMAGYAVGYPLGQSFDPVPMIILCVGLYFTSAGSFALNQAQEWRADLAMPRTRGRPIPRGVFSPLQGYLIGLLLLIPGLLCLRLLGPWPAGLALFTVVLYNGIYTMYWKRRWVFGAVPGAIPGAMPVVIGYSVNTTELWRPDCVYLFLVMFLWQMPHFWALAIRFREDYAKGGFPVLPVKLGVERSLYHIGLYTFTYVGVALTAPFFLQSHLVYLLMVVPVSMKVIWEFFKYFKSIDGKAWLPFFLWTNLSLLIYLGVPVMDKWLSYQVPFWSQP